MTLESQVVGTGQACRASANDRHLFARWGILEEWNGRIEQALFGSIAVHAANGDFFLNQSTPAGLLTGSRTGETKNIWEGQHFFDQACRLFHRTFSDQLQVAWNVDMRGAIDLAGWLTIGIVVREYHLQVGAPDME